MWRKIIARLIVCLIVLIAGGTAALVVYFYPPLRLIARTVAGDRCVCSLTAALSSYRTTMRLQERLLEAHSRTCTRVRADGQGFVLWRTPKGKFWAPPGPEWLLPHLLAEQDRGVYGSAESGPRQGDIVLDCGAHVGVFVRQALNAGAKLAVAIEPAPANVECLRRNFAGEINAGRVVVIPQGVWDRRDVLALHVDLQNSARDTVLGGADKTGSDIEVPLTTIDNLASELQLNRVDFIKMDIEGAERRALAGAREVLRRFRPRLSVASYHLQHDPDAIRELVLRIEPAYRMSCGQYTQLASEIIPETLFFW